MAAVEAAVAKRLLRHLLNSPPRLCRNPRRNRAEAENTKVVAVMTISGLAPDASRCEEES